MELDIHFEDKSEFDMHWQENLSNLYNFHDRGANYLGEFEIYRCKFNKKAGYSSCKGQIKVVFPDNDNSVGLYESSDVHTDHEPIDGPVHKSRFVWRQHPEADKIVKAGVEHNDFPSQIKFALDKAGVDPMPSTAQLNTRICYLRSIGNIHPSVYTSTDLLELIEQDLEVPSDVHKPFINGYKVEIMENSQSRFWFNMTTVHLTKRIIENPLKLFQVDPTYKLMHEGFPVFVHGTSNTLHEFLCSGLIVASNEDELTFREFFESLKFDDLKELMGDCSKAISKAKENVWPKDPFENSITLIIKFKHYF